MRLLVLTHTFPPSTHANAKRPHYLVRGFLDAGWQVDVVTSPLGMPDDTRETVDHPALRIFRLDDPVQILLRKCRRIPWLFRLTALSVAGVMWPDAFAGWARKVFRLIREQPAYERTLAFILPASLLLGGRRPGLVNRTWTFDYQESVTPQQRQLQRRSPLQRAWLPRLAALECHTLHLAGRVVFTADTNRQAYIRERLVPAAATVHVPYFLMPRRLPHRRRLYLPDSRSFISARLIGGARVVRKHSCGLWRCFYNDIPRRGRKRGSAFTETGWLTTIVSSAN